MTGGVTQLVAHAATKSALFLVAGAWLTALGTKQLARAARRRPQVPAGRRLFHGRCAGPGRAAAAVAVGCQGRGARHGPNAENTALYVVGLAAAALAAVYSVKALWYVTRPVPDDANTAYDTEQRGTRCVARTTPAPLMVLVGVAATLGVPGAAHSRGVATRPARRQGRGFSPAPWELGLSAGVALAAAAIAWWPARGGLRLCGGGQCGGRRAGCIWSRPRIWLSRGL